MGTGTAQTRMIELLGETKRTSMASTVADRGLVNQLAGLVRAFGLPESVTLKIIFGYGGVSGVS
jgi:hypothetical protein